MIALALALLTASAPSVTVAEQDGHVVCQGGAGQVILAGGGGDHDPSLSPDGHTVAFVRTLQMWPDSNEIKVNALWLGDCRTGQAHQILSPRDSDQAEKRLNLLAGPTFSLDGGYVYVQSEAWVTSGAIHQVRLRDGREKYITDGNSLSVIRTGPYRGYLLTQKHAYRGGSEGGSYDPTYVVRPDNRWEMKVPGTDNEGETDLTAEWLAKKGWTAW